MRTHSITERRQQLRDICSRLGRDATPAQIREEAYRVGFGKVNKDMLIFVRNELWPDRPKHTAGCPVGVPRTELVASVVKDVAICPQCHSWRTTVLSTYRRDGSRTDRSGGQCPGSVRRRRKCSDCGNVFATVDEDGGGAKSVRRQMHIAATEKTCSKCKQTLPVSCFGKQANDADLYRASCSECLRVARSELAFRKALANHNLTREEYERVLESQRGVCAICCKPGNPKRKRHYPLNFDHCHKTGKFRGLLCDRCNLGIGNFDDDVERFRAVIDYLQRSNSS